MTRQPTFSHPAQRIDGAARGVRVEALAEEAPLEIHVDRVLLATTMRTPGADRALAAGYALTSGAVRSASELRAVRHASTAADAQAAGNVIWLSTATPGADRAGLVRMQTVSTSCGLCGAGSIESMLALAAPRTNTVRLAAAAVPRLLDMLRARQPIFAATGATHAAALVPPDGHTRPADWQPVFEDVGRHNAVDKAIGHAALSGMSPRNHVLLLSGRVSFEIVQKAAAAGIEAIVAVSAPTALAVQAAERAGISVIGFVRGDRFNVYTHASRVV